MPGAVGFRDCESGQRERWGPFTVHGLFIRRRHDVAEVYTRMVLEAQPDVLDAIRHASRAKLVQRSICLTPFGRDFCEVCLPLHTAEVQALADLDP